MFKVALFSGPPVTRLAVTVAAALSVGAATLPAIAQDSRSLQDMLLAAVRLGDTVTVRSLLAAGADVARRGANGKTAIDVAVETSRFDIADLLIQERRRQRDTAMAQPAHSADVEIDQRSAEAAPDVIPQRVVSLPKAPLPAPAVTYVPMPPAQATALPLSVPNGTTVEQLLAAAQQLTLAAQNLAAAQRGTASREIAPSQSVAQPVRAAQAVDPDFLPKPGRKPEIAQAALTQPSRPAEASVTASNTVVVTPRRRTVDESVEQARRDLESVDDLPVIPPAAATPQSSSPASVRVTPSARAPLTVAAPAPALDGDEPDNGLIRAVKGIGGFLGIGDKRTEAVEPTATPTHAKPGSARDMMKRDRTNVPHVPARRANELQSQAEPQAQPQQQTVAALRPSIQGPSAAPIQAGMPPVMAVPVTPVQGQPLTATGQTPPPNMAVPSVQTARLNVRKNSGLNPFDPDNMPQGSVLPLTDPVAGNAPEIARAKMLPDEEKIAEEASLRETLRSSAAAQRATKPQMTVAEVPPLRDPAGPASPTSMFERRASQPAPVVAAKPAAKPEEGILRSMASAVGINTNDDEMPNDPPAGVSNSERVTSGKMPVLSLRQPLADVALTLGNSVATDQKPLPRGVAEPDPCIKRSGGALQFCVVPVDWHPRVDPAFSLTTYLYQGSRAIARYDGGKATHYHTLFNSLAYDDVVKYLTW